MNERFLLHHNSVFIGLTTPRALLDQRIDQWVDDRLRHGMVEEVERLLDRGVSHERFEEIGLEYRWVSRFIRGIVSRKEMIRRLQSAIHHYSRRQISFMRQDRRIKWFDITEVNFYARIEEYLKEHRSEPHD